MFTACFVLVVTKLEFTVRPPAAIYARISQTVVINCTAGVAPGFPFAYVQWVIKPLCGDMSVNYDAFPNGTLVISQTTLQNTGVYKCRAYTLEETITAAVYLYVSSGRVMQVGCN